MVTIYSSRLMIPEKYKCLDDCEAFFDGVVKSSEFGTDDISAIRDIDNAELINRSVGTVKTPFGVVSVNSLSTGCKVVLSYLHLLRHREMYPDKVCLCVNECGYNALDLLFGFADRYNSNIVFLLEHYNGIHKCKERDYIFDNERRRKL